MTNGKNRFQIILILVCIFVCLWGILSCQDKQDASGIKKSSGDNIDFTLKDLTGKSFTLSGQQSKPVLLIFSATWCPSCRSEIPHFKQLYSTYGRLGLIIVNIDIQESPEKVSHFSSNNALPYRVLLDMDGSVATAYNIRGIPSLVLIGRDGKLISQDYVMMDSILADLFHPG